MNIERPEKTFGISRLLALPFLGTNLEVSHPLKSSWCFSGALQACLQLSACVYVCVCARVYVRTPIGCI